jgi:hypothetical protein
MNISYEERYNYKRGFNYSYLVVSFVGTLANILAFIVFSRKKFENTVFATYFRALLIIDTIGLLYLAIGKFLYFEFNINLRNLNAVLCKITMPCAYSIPSISAYLTVIISFDRWLTIAKPTVLLIRKKRKFQIHVCIIIIFVNLIYNGQLFFSYLDINPIDNEILIQCLIPNEKLLSTMDLINNTILPFILMILFTSLTINAVFVSRRKIRHAAMNASSSLPSSFDLSRKRDIKFAITAILLNIIFLLLNGPFTSSYFIFNNFLNRYGQIDFVRAILLLSYMNHASVFFINLAVNTQFKEELFSLYLETKQRLA